AVSPGQARSQLSLASGTISEELVLANVGFQPGVQIQEVRLHVKENNTNWYWTGSGWDTSPAAYAAASVHQSSWSFSSMPNWFDGYTYTLWAEAFDKAGNAQVVFSGNGSSVTFTSDELAPTASVTSVQTSTRIASLASVSGTANDANWSTNSGIAGAVNTQVQVSFLLGAVTYYYDNANTFSSGLSDANSWWPAASWTPQGPSSGTWTYAPAQLGSSMISDRTYSIRVRTQDNAIPVSNPADPMANISGVYNVVFDTTPPSLGITSPAEAVRTRTIPAIAGTANADLSGLKDVRLNVYSFTAGAWQPVSSNNQANSIWSSSWSWTTLSGLVTNTTYQVAARVQDQADNWSTVYSTVTFVYDTTPPSVSVALPLTERYYGVNSAEAAYYLGIMDGSASDQFGVARVEVQIYDVMISSYWYTTGWAVGASTWQYAGADSWSYAPPPFVNGYRYRLEARAFDIAGNMSSYATSYFYYDSGKPGAVMQSPGTAGFYNVMSQISGTAADPAGSGPFKSDMLKVETGIQQNPPTGLWWTGTSFTSGVMVWLPDTSHPWPNWSLSGASTPSWVTNTKYHIESRAMDVARNTSTIVTQDFIYDTQVPAAVVTEPTGLLNYLSSLVNIQGASADSNGLGEIQQAQARVRNLGNNQYWSWGTNNYTESSPDAAWFVASTTETVPYSKWFSTGTPPGAPSGVNLVSGGSYEINARALDKAGNYSSVFSTRTITYDIHKPTGAVTALAGVSPAAYQREINPLSGSGSDGPSGGAAGLALINAGGAQVRVLEKDTGKWWDNSGGSFNISDGNSGWTNSNGGSSALWNYTHTSLNGALVTGRTYLAQYRSSDQSFPANTGQSSDGLDSLFTLAKDSVTFVADRLEPVSRVTFPLENARLKALGAITGTAMDALSGIAAMGQIAVSIQEVSPAAGWWNGVVPGTFTAASETFYPLAAGINGNFAAPPAWSFSAPLLRDGYTYRVRVRATDNAMPGGNVEAAISSITFVYDITAPAAAITYPIGLPDLRANLNALAAVSVSGTALEAFGLKSASVSVQEVGGPYYDAQTSTFNSPTQKWITATISGTGPNYTWSVAAPPLTDNKNYDLQVVADDLAGNVLIP
ncbi:MAG: hypothetical protein Q8O90_12380, partial [Elusimicrobiota bacterium]|nr:hypothetical protein [Elusimicrobiota bacterium]